MAVLIDADRVAVWKDFMAQLSSDRENLGVMTKADMRAAVNAIDDWIEANSAAFNTAIPQPARGALTASQKARLFFFIARKRFGG